MSSRRFVAVVISASVFLGGCAGKRIKIDPSNPAYQPKSDFERDYGFFITPDERKIGYTIETHPTLPEPIMSFDKIDTLDEFRKFEKHFWDIRDTDPNTPQNEYKELIDSRIRNIEKEIFMTDLDIPGTSFRTNGGLKGDLARVYLLWGAPAPRSKLKFSGNYFDLMVWYYWDPAGKPLMRFLFYEKYSRFELFREHSSLIDWAFTLQRISKRTITSEEELQSAWYELEQNDIDWAFRAALIEFSYYTHIDKKTRWTIDKALESPEPAALTARRFKPTILGQPNILEGVELFESGYHSFLPAYIRTSVAPDNPTFLMIIILRKNVDWAKQDNEEKPYAANMNLRVSFQNKKTLKLTEFMTYYRFELSQEEFNKRDNNDELTGSVVAHPVTLPHFDGENLGLTLGEMLKQLEPGEYVVNIYLQHTFTKKYNALREEITIK